MTYDEFIKKHNGVAVNYDGAAGKQCVDLATAYFNEVFGSGIKNFWYDAHHFWDLFDKNTWLKANFTKVKNTPSFVQKGRCSDMVRHVERRLGSHSNLHR